MVMMSALIAQIVTRCLSRGTGRVMVVRLVHARVREHGRGVLAVVVVMGSGDHGVTVRVLAGLGLMRR